MKARIILSVLFICVGHAILNSEICIAEKEEATSPSVASKWARREEIKALSKEMFELAISGDDASFSRLVEYANNSDPKVRSIAARALGRAKHKDAFDVLLILFHDKNSRVRASATMAMGMRRDDRAYDYLMEALEKDESSEVKGKAVYALGRMRTDRSRETVISCLKSNVTEVRKYAAMSLRRADDKAVIEPLIGALLDADDGVRKAAEKSLISLTGQEKLYDPQATGKDEAHKAWQEWWMKNKEAFTIVKRRRMAMPSAKELLEQFDTDKDKTLGEKELQAALDDIAERRVRGKKGGTLKVDVNVKGPDGTVAKLGDFTGETTAFYYFSSACPHCRDAEDFIKKLYESYAGKGITFVGITSSRDRAEDLKPYLDRVKFGFKVVHDEGKEFASKNGVTGTPNLLIVEKSGKILEHYRGLSPKMQDQVAGTLSNIVAGKESPHKTFRNIFQ